MIVDNLEIKLKSNSEQAASGLANLSSSLEKTKSAASGVKQSLKNVSQQTKAVADSTKDATKGTKDAGKSAKDSAKHFDLASTKIGNLASAFKRIAMYRFLRSTIKAITDAVKVGVGNLYQYSSALNSLDSASAKSTLDSYASAFLTLKNSVGAAVAPVLQSLLPIIQTVVNAIVDAFNWFNKLISALQGKSTYTKAVAATTQFAQSTDKAAGSAKKLMQVLMDFDELNVINTPSKGGGGGGNAGSTDYGSMFEETGIDTNFSGNWLVKGVGNLINGLLHPSIDVDFLSAVRSIFTPGLNWISEEMLEILPRDIRRMFNNILTPNISFNFDWDSAFKSLFAPSTTALNTVLSSLPIKFETIFNTKVLLPIRAWFQKNVVNGWVGDIVKLFNGGDWIVNLVDNMFGHGLDVGSNYVKGLKASISEEEANSQVVPNAKKAADKITNAFKDKWEIHSPSRVTEDMGKNLMIGLKQGILSNYTQATSTMLFVAETLVSKIDSVNLKSKGGEMMSQLAQGIRSDSHMAENAFTSLLNTLIAKMQSFVNKIVGAFNDLFRNFANAGNKLSVTSAGNIRWTAVSSINIKKMAEGGFIPGNKGQLFVARENGPELVGQASGGTAVMNNDQIVESVSNGVYQAMVSTGFLGYLQGIENNTAGSGKVVFSPSAQAGRWISKSLAMYQAQGV